MFAVGLEPELSNSIILVIVVIVLADEICAQCSIIEGIRVAYAR